MSNEPPSQNMPFGKAVAQTYRGIKDDFTKKENVDNSVREQVNADIDKLIEKHDQTSRLHDAILSAVANVEINDLLEGLTDVTAYVLNTCHENSRELLFSKYSDRLLRARKL